MKHKKQAYDQIERTLNWNTVRGNDPSTLDWNLEIDMLQEELDELKEAVEANDKVAILDALLDLKFVGTGTMGKMGLSSQDIVDGYEHVISANETKSKEKNAQGKITKPSDFVGPEINLNRLLKRIKDKLNNR